jgi:hypothetical protein
MIGILYYENLLILAFKVLRYQKTLKKMQTLNNKQQN